MQSGQWSPEVAVQTSELSRWRRLGSIIYIISFYTVLNSIFSGSVSTDHPSSIGVVSAARLLIAFLTKNTTLSPLRLLRQLYRLLNLCSDMSKKSSATVNVDELDRLPHHRLSDSRNLFACTETPTSELQFDSRPRHNGPHSQFPDSKPGDHLSPSLKGRGFGSSLLG